MHIMEYQKTEHLNSNVHNSNIKAACTFHIKDDISHIEYIIMMYI